MKCEVSDVVWPSVSVRVSENEEEEEEAGWQPILATSLQQLLKEWYFWSQLLVSLKLEQFKMHCQFTDRHIHKSKY